MAAEISTKPYLIRAIYEWCTDNGYTPYLAVSVDERTIVPREHVKAGEIVLNVSASATNRLELGNDLISFQARFGGVARELSIPIDNVTAIYAKESGHGMAFEVAKAPAVPAPASQGPAQPSREGGGRRGWLALAGQPSAAPGGEGSAPGTTPAPVAAPAALEPPAEGSGADGRAGGAQQADAADGQDASIGRERQNGAAPAAIVRDAQGKATASEAAAGAEGEGESADGAAPPEDAGPEPGPEDKGSGGRRSKARLTRVK